MPTVMVRETASAPQPTGEHRRTRRIVAVAAVDRPGGAETTSMRLPSGLRAELEVLGDRERMGTAARERARRFDSDRYAERMEAPLAT